MYAQLADSNGRHVIPYTQRLSIGSIRRNRAGTGAAPFPDKWLVEPNRLDRLDDVLPDSQAKQAAHARGQPYRASPVVGRDGKDGNPGAKP